MARRSWAIKVLDSSQEMSEQATQRYDELEIIMKGVDAAVLNLEKHVKNLDQKNANAQVWAADIKREQESSGTDWETSIKRLRSIPAANDMIQFVTGRDLRKSDRKATLEDLIEVEEIRRAAKSITKVSASLSRNGVELGTKVDEIMALTDALFEKVEKNPARLAVGKAREPTQLMQDIEPIAKKVSNDYESILGYQNTPKSLSQASKSALLHTKNFLPNLSKRSLEMYEMLRQVTELRNKVTAEGIEIMHDIATLTSMVGEANSHFTAMNLGTEAEDAFALISMLNTLPHAYASFVAEAIRRREWSDKVRSDSSTLANEMATFQEEEGKRRRRWQKNVGFGLWGEKAEPQVVGLEVNLRGDEEQWPQARRADLEELIESLRSQGTKPAVISDISKLLAELDNPTKQQSKRAKAFKAGSIHENALGRSTLLVRGDDELVRVLQEEKQKTESKLKTAESRVRRLEDLLHRQSHISKTSTGNVFQLPGTPTSDMHNPLASPRPQDDLSRRSSVSSRRFSSNQSAEEKAMQQKLLSMEGELMTERERISGLQHQIVAGKAVSTNLQDLVDEANSTKKDLMANFDAQQREFIEERKSLEGEIKRLKSKMEELEDELDRYLGSRENERMTIDDRVRTLQEELENFRKETAAEAQKAQGQVEFLRNEAKIQREANESLEKQILEVNNDKRDLEAHSKKMEALAEEQALALEEIYQQLSPHTKIPEETSALIESVVALSGDLVAELESVKSDATIARSDRDTSQATIATLKGEFEEVQTKLIEVEAESAKLRDALDQEKARFTALEGEMVDEREQLASLRTKIADGETGSETLRTRLEDEEKKVTSMSKDLAARLSRVGALEEELRTSQDKHHSAQTRYERLALRFEARTSRAKDLTQRVYAQNDRLCRLLERLSYSVTREGSSMTIQRMPKLDRSVVNANDSSDPGTNMKRSISGGIHRKAMADSGDLDLLYWMHNDDVEVESEKYASYMNAIGAFDIESFCEVITKRVKDMEYTAKKYSKDARAYRDKSHMAQKEAHEKIAFKNFKEGDLALFLPTRNQATGAWAAFNVGAPHYFLREQDSHKLRSRDWLLARIHKIEDRVVDLSKSMSSTHLNVSDGRSFGETSNGGDSFEDDNPFDLSDGLRWYLIDAAEEKPGAPSTPGLGKSTVASAHIDATGDIRRSKKSSSGGVDGINRTLSKSLDSRRSSSNSKKTVPGASGLIKSASTAADNASLKSTSTAQISTEISEAQMIRRGSKDAGGSSERNPNVEVRNHEIDDLLGP